MEKSTLREEAVEGRESARQLPSAHWAQRGRWKVLSMKGRVLQTDGAVKKKQALLIKIIAEAVNASGS